MEEGGGGFTNGNGSRACARFDYKQGNRLTAFAPRLEKGGGCMNALLHSLNRYNRSSVIDYGT